MDWAVQLERTPNVSVHTSCLIVLCHGVGADGRQLANVGDAWRKIMPTASFMFPDAPEARRRSLLSRLFGRKAVGRQWFSLALPRKAQIAAAYMAAVALNRRVDIELARLGLPAGAVCFCGFSQGAMVSLLAGTMRHATPRAIVGMAGALLASDEDFDPRCRPPVLLIHGTADKVVPSLRSETACRRLREAGFTADLVLLPGQDHMIVRQAAPIAADFILGATGTNWPDPNPEEVLAALPNRLHEPVLLQAHQNPDAIALLDSRGLWNFAALAEAVRQGATTLATAGVRGGDRVMVITENCREACALLLACSAIDAWAVMVNARLAASEIEAIAARCTPRVILSVDASVQSRAHAAHFGLKKIEIPGLGKVFAGAACASAQPEPVHASADQVAALIYTSGSSGEPKGVMLSHRNLLYMAAISGSIRGLSRSDRFLGLLPISHIVGLSVVFLGALMHGAAVQLVMRFNPASLLAAFAKDRISIVLGAPAMLSLLLDYAANANRSLVAPHLRILSVSGAPLQEELKIASEAFFGIPVHHGYGITECGPTIAQIRPGAERPDCSVGPLLPGVEARFIGPDGQDVPDGEVGELLVRSPSVMLGYYRDPDQTATVLDSDGWFHTGDLGRLDGNDLTVVGRAKDVIIRFGFNVYPAEVEAVLARHPSVLQVAVIGQPSAGGEEILAFIVRRAGAHPDFSALAQHAARHLSSYKRPTRYFLRAALPTTPTGKILKRALLEEMAFTTLALEVV